MSVYHLPDGVAQRFGKIDAFTYTANYWDLQAYLKDQSPAHVRDLAATKAIVIGHEARTLSYVEQRMDRLVYRLSQWLIDDGDNRKHITSNYGYGDSVQYWENILSANLRLLMWTPLVINLDGYGACQVHVIGASAHMVAEFLDLMKEADPLKQPYPPLWMATRYECIKLTSPFSLPILVVFLDMQTDEIWPVWLPKTWQVRRKAKDYEKLIKKYRREDRRWIRLGP